MLAIDDGQSKASKQSKMTVDDEMKSSGLRDEVVPK